LKVRAAIRTKGDHAQGMGDVTGSVALAGRFKDAGFDVIIVIEDGLEAALALRDAGVDFLTVGGIPEDRIWREIGPLDVTVVNQLNSSRDLLALLKRRTRKLVTIDDVGEASRSLADLRINPLYYDAGAICDFAFVPLSEVFREARSRAGRVDGKVKRILVTLGGSDPCGFTPRVVDYLGETGEDTEIVVLLGSAFRHSEKLDEVIGRSPRSFCLKGPVDARGMTSLMAGSDMVICSGGNTMFEAACLGRPAVVVCSTPFEVETAQRLMDAGIVVNLGFGGDLLRRPFVEAVKGLMEDFPARAKMSREGCERVDGRGTERMFREILSTLGERHERSGDSAAHG